MMVKSLSWICREIMHAMWKPQKFKMIYLLATLYVLTLTLPSASAVYWAYGDMLLDHSNALSLLPRTAFRDTAIILMLIHQVRFSCMHIHSFNQSFIHKLLLNLIWFPLVIMCTVHNIRICLHSSILCVGKIHRHSWNKEHHEALYCTPSGGYSNLVPSHYFPILWTH